MSRPQKPKEHRLNLRLSESEWNRIQQRVSSTTCRNLSEYCRKVLLNKPVRTLVRDQSFDDFEEDLVPLLPILDSQKRNFGRLIDAPDINTPDKTPALLEAHREFQTTASHIKALLIKIADLCARK